MKLTERKTTFDQYEGCCPICGAEKSSKQPYKSKYFCCDYGYGGRVRYAIGNCEVIYSSDEDVEDRVACGKKNVPGLSFSNSMDELEDAFICLSCINDLLAENPDYVPGYMIGDDT